MAKLSKHHQTLEDSAESEAARLAEIERVLWDTAKVVNIHTSFGPFRITLRGVAVRISKKSS